MYISYSVLPSCCQRRYVILISNVAAGSIWHTTVTIITTSNQVQLSFFAVVHAPLQKKLNYCLQLYVFIWNYWVEASNHFYTGVTISYAQRMSEEVPQVLLLRVITTVAGINLAMWPLVAIFVPCQIFLPQVGVALINSLHWNSTLLYTLFSGTATLHGQELTIVSWIVYVWVNEVVASQLLCDSALSLSPLLPPPSSLPFPFPFLPYSSSPPDSLAVNGLSSH